jgi:hypothetical protein
MGRLRQLVVIARKSSLVVRHLRPLFLQRSNGFTIPHLVRIELVEITTDCFEGALAPDDVARLEAHLTKCDACTEYIRQMRMTQAAPGQVDVAAIAAPTRERLPAAFRAWKSDRLDA